MQSTEVGSQIQWHNGPARLKIGNFPGDWYIVPSDRHIRMRAATTRNGNGPTTICFIMYQTRPEYLPPLHNGAISFSRNGFNVEGIGITDNVLEQVPEYERFNERFSIDRVKLPTRRFFSKLPKNILTTPVGHLIVYAEYTIRAALTGLSMRMDIVEAHDFNTLLPAWIVAAVKGKPLILRAHELFPETRANMPFAGFWKWMGRRFIPRTDLVVVPEENRARIIREEYRPGKAPLVVMNCPPYRAPVSGTKLREHLDNIGKPAKHIALYQGLIDSERCIEEMLKAADHFSPGTRLVIMGVGFGEWRNADERLKSYDEVVRLKRVPYDQLAQYTASADVGLLFYRNTCRNNYYCAPNKLYEYMMMGLPVVTCDYPGLKSFVEREKVGICVDPENPEAIAGAINRLTGDRALYETTRANCLRLTRDRYNWEKEFVKLERAYEEILQAR